LFLSSIISFVFPHFLSFSLAFLFCCQPISHSVRLFLSFSNLLSSFIPFCIISASLFSSAIFVKSSWSSFKPPTPKTFSSLSLSQTHSHTHILFI
jgi:hypothetical protein